MNNTEQYRERLWQGIQTLDLDVSEDQLDQLLAFLALLLKWNAAYNLSGIKDGDKMVGLHLLDSLSVLPFIGAEKQRILDVGTGAGLPGIPLAICRPDCHFTLLDSNGKKTRFLFQAVLSLGLRNVTVANQRIESFQSVEQIDIVTTRAFASLGKTLAWIDHLLPSGSRLLAMKGQFPEGELEEVPDVFSLVRSHQVEIPGEDCERQLLEVVRTA